MLSDFNLAAGAMQYRPLLADPRKDNVKIEVPIMYETSRGNLKAVRSSPHQRIPDLVMGGDSEAGGPRRWIEFKSWQRDATLREQSRRLEANKWSGLTKSRGATMTRSILHELGIIERLKPFKYLWKIDDPKWRKKRNSDWRVLRKHYYNKEPKADIPNYRSYFLEGELVDLLTDCSMYFLTPITSTAEARKFVLDGYYKSPAQKNFLLTGFFSLRNAHVADWYEDHAKFLIDGILGEEYTELPAVDPSGHNTALSPGPTQFSYYFLNNACRLFEGRIAYSAYILRIEYFISSLKLADRNYYDFQYLRILMPELFDLLEKADGNNKLSNHSKEFASLLNERKDEIGEIWTSLISDEIQE